MRKHRLLLFSFIDQGLVSLGGALISIFAARALDVADFGLFGLVFGAYTLCLGVSQSLISQPLLIHASTDTSDSARMRGQATADAISLALGASIVFIFVGLVAHAPVWFAVALVAPALFVQDALRASFSCMRRQDLSLASDITWFLLLLGSFASLSQVSSVSPSSIFLTWGACSLIAALIAMAVGRVRPRWTWLSFVRQHSASGYPLLGQWIAVLGSQQVANFSATGFLGLPTMAAVRGAQTLLGPLNVLSNGTVQYVIPSMARQLPTHRQQRSIALFVGISLSMFTLACGIFLHYLPTAWGEALMGKSWPVVSQALLPLTIFASALAATTGASCVFRFRKSTREILRLNLVFGPSQILVAVPASIWFGLPGFLWGLAFVAVAMVPLWWFRLLQITQRSL